jgi:hypothetical protein
MSHLVALVHDIRASKRPRDLLVAGLAAAQHGVIARWQLFELGFGRGAIAHYLKVGRLHRVHPGVYAVGHTKLTERGRWWQPFSRAGRMRCSVIEAVRACGACCRMDGHRST